MLTVDQALEILQGSASPLGVVELPLAQALGHALAEEIRADRPLPPFNRVTMDGFALRAADLQSKEQQFDIIGILGAGEDPDVPLGENQAIQIMTGAALPETADAVIQIELASIEGDKVRFDLDSIAAKKNVAQKGEDAQEGQLFFSPGEVITPSMAAFLASVGKANVQVYRKPTMAVLSTGTEILPVEATPKFYQIRDCNSWTIQGMSAALGLESQSLGIALDEEKDLKEKIKAGLEADVLVLSGGVSMGEFDLVPKILQESGVAQVFHKVFLKPGKPIWFGRHETGFVFGLPGNPVSVQACFKLFTEPLLLGLMGHKNPGWGSFWLPLAGDIKKKTEREQFTPAKIEKNALAEVRIQGSGDFSNLVQSTGMLRMPAEARLLHRGELVEFIPWRRIS